MLKKITVFLLLCTALLTSPQTAFAQTTDTETNPTEQPAPTQPKDNFYRAKVTKILEAGTEELDGQPQEYQKLQLRILDGNEKDKQIIIDHGKGFIIGSFQTVAEGETVVVAKPAETPGAREIYYIVDKYRAPRLALLAILFFAAAIVFGRKRGLTSIIGLIFTIIVLFYYVLPHISNGGNPLLTCVIGALVIIVFSLYLSHGFNRRTTIALVSTLIALGAALLIDIFFVHFAKLTGSGTEEAFYLQFENFAINLRGLLLGSILIGVVGVLDDITTGQSAVVEEIYTANTSVSFTELYKSGLSVGREHIASLVNTLVLAYVGASFPLLLLYTTNRLQPLWITLNSNFIAEEIVRTLVGSTVLVVAVPLTTFLAAYYYTHLKPRRLPTNQSPASAEDAIADLWSGK